MTTLYEVSAEYRAMAERLADLGMDDQTIADTLEAEGGDLTVKSTNVAFVARGLEETAKSIKEAELQMAARRKALENRAERLRKYLFDSMKLAGVQKIDSPYFSLSIKKNPPSVDVYEPGLVPAAYMTDPPPPPPAIDKKLIAQALKDDYDVPGCRLVQGERLDIR